MENAFLAVGGLCLSLALVWAMVITHQNFERLAEDLGELQAGLEGLAEALKKTARIDGDVSG